MTEHNGAALIPAKFRQSIAATHSFVCGVSERDALGIPRLQAKRLVRLTRSAIAAALSHIARHS
jgi:hypothetical protein